VKGKQKLVKDAEQNVHDIEEELKEYDIGPDDLLEEEKDACILLGRRKTAAEYVDYLDMSKMFSIY
jgi:hypothetical protein